MICGGGGVGSGEYWFFWRGVCWRWDCTSLPGGADGAGGVSLGGVSLGGE